MDPVTHSQKKNHKNIHVSKNGKNKIIAGMVAHAWNPSTQEAEAGELQVEASLIYTEFQAFLGYVGRPCLTHTHTRKKQKEQAISQHDFHKLKINWHKTVIYIYKNRRMYIYLLWCLLWRRKVMDRIKKISKNNIGRELCSDVLSWETEEYD
jgi:hypothetical protein